MCQSGQLSHTRAVVTTVESSKREPGFKEVTIFTLGVLTFAVDRIELSRRRAGNKFQRDTVLLLVGFESLHWLVSVILGDCAERILNVLDTENVTLVFSAHVALRVGIGNSYLLPNRIVVDRELGGTCGIAFSGGYLESVRDRKH